MNPCFDVIHHLWPASDCEQGVGEVAESDERDTLESYEEDE
jgi:hypothetical protein